MIYAYYVYYYHNVEQCNYSICFECHFLGFYQRKIISLCKNRRRGNKFSLTTKDIKLSLTDLLLNSEIFF